MAEFPNVYFPEQDELTEYLLGQYRERPEEPFGEASPVYIQEKVGKFVDVGKPNWAAHSRAVYDNRLGFSPQRYPFDRLILQHFNFPPLYDPKHPQFKQYAPLRHNIAVLRNYILNHFYPTGIPLNGEAEQINNYIGQIALYTGAMLNRGSGTMGNLMGFFSHPSTGRVMLDDANVMGGGAAELYKHLFAVQEKNGWSDMLLAPFRFFSRPDSWPDYHWKLPPIELTPFWFQRAKMTTPPAPPPSMRRSLEDAAGMAALAYVDALDLDALGSKLTHDSLAFNPVESLSHPKKLEAIAIAREILDKLRIAFEDVPLFTLVDFDPGLLMPMFSDVDGVNQLFLNYLGEAARINPMILEDPDILAAQEAVGRLGYHAKLVALKQARLSGDDTLIELIKKELDAMPASWKAGSDATVSDLLTVLRGGLDKAFQAYTVTQESGVVRPDNLRALQDNLLAQQAYQKELEKVRAIGMDDIYQQVVAQRRGQQQAFAANVATAFDPSRPRPLSEKPNPLEAALERASQRATLSRGVKPVAITGLVNPAEMQKMRASLAKETTGPLIEANTAKQVIADTLNRQTRQSPPLMPLKLDVPPRPDKQAKQPAKPPKRTDLDQKLAKKKEEIAPPLAQEVDAQIPYAFGASNPPLPTRPRPPGVRL